MKGEGQMKKNSKMLLVALCAVVLAAGSIPLFGDELADAQNKLLAYRAARADAIRKLAERINGLHITSETYVKDFVTESDTIDTSMRSFLSGVKEDGKPKYASDGICTVKMTVKMEDVIVTLKQIHNRYVKGSKVKVEDFEKMRITNKEKFFTETGMGSPRPDNSGAFINIPAGESAVSINMPANAAQYWGARVTGQGRLMAVRAAHVEALRRLGERLKGVQITSETYVRDFVAESDEIDANMRAFVIGAKETKIRYHDNELIVEVTMEVNLQTVLTKFKSWVDVHYKGDKVKVTKLEKKIVTIKNEKISETGMGVPPRKYLKKDISKVEASMITAVTQIPAWVGQVKTAKGQAAVDTNMENRVQAELMAQRAAELDARRKLSEEVLGMFITSNTSVSNFVANHDDIRTAMLSFQQGAKVVEGSQKVTDGKAEVTVEIKLTPLWDTILYYQKKLQIELK